MKFGKDNLKNSILIFVPVILLIFFVFKHPKFIFLFLLIFITASITSLNYLITLPLDVTPVFFFSLIITSKIGLWYSFIFTILSGFLPSVLLKEFKPSSLIYLISNFFINIFSLYVSLNFINFIFLSFLYFLIVSIINGILEENLIQEIVFNFISLGINVIYFLKFSGLLNSILI